MAQAAKQLKKIKDIEAQALQEQKEKEESNRKRRNRSRDRKKKVRGRRRRPRTEAPGVAAGRRSAALRLTPRERQVGGRRAGRAASGPRGSGEPPRDSFQHLEQRPALRRNFCRLWGSGVGKGLPRGAQGCSPAFLRELLWVKRAGGLEVVLSVRSCSGD